MVTKIQKKKVAERTAKQRQEFLASLETPLIVVHSPALEQLLKPSATLGRPVAWSVGPLPMEARSC